MMYTIEQTQKFHKWFAKVNDKIAKNQIMKRLKNIQQFGHFGDYKPLKDGLYELRISAGKGYRIYYTKRGNDIILLLAGGHKGTQSGDIALAKKLLDNLE